VPRDDLEPVHPGACSEGVALGGHPDTGVGLGTAGTASLR
jgi:hypothetical protein